MEVAGTVMNKKISENEFSYWWCIPEFLSGHSYQSPKLGSLCDEFSSCHLEIKTHIGLHQISRFFLCSSKVQSETKFTFSSSLEHGIRPKPKEVLSIESHDLKPSVKIFSMDPSQHVNPFFIFRLNLKLCKGLNATSSFSDSNFQDIDEKSGSWYDPAKNEAIVEGDEDSKGKSSLSSSAFEREPRFAQHIEYSEVLVEDLRYLYTSGAMSDLEIRIGETTFLAHKSMLGARSPVLKKMIENSEEALSNFITITDCSAISFEKFLLYLYTGELEDRTLSTLMSFYSLSIKYDVPVLREFCSNMFQDYLYSKPVECISNIVCDILKMSKLVDSKLKTAAKSYIVNHFGIVSNKKSWKEFVKSNFESASEILALVGKKEATVEEVEDIKEKGFRSSITFEREPESTQRIEYSDELVENLRYLYTSGIMSDLEIRIGKNTLHAHKSILGARSSVLKKMIETSEGASSNVITIIDCSASSFEKFLLYLYSGDIEDRTLNTLKLIYSLSIKYDVPDLKEFCSSVLQSKFYSKPNEDVSNIVCDVLKLSELVDLKLKSAATSYIVQNFSVVSNKQSWKDLKEGNFELASEILALVVNTCRKTQT